MAIRSSYAKEIAPSLPSIKAEFGLSFGGVSFSSLSVEPGTGRSRWSNNVSCSRVFCSCGYSGAKLAEDADWNSAGHCPQCGKPLIDLGSDGWRSGKENNIKTREVYVTDIDGDVLQVDRVKFTVSPQFPKGMVPSDDDYVKAAYLSTMKIETERARVVDIKKQADGSLKLVKYSPVSNIIVPNIPEVNSFLGWVTELFRVQNRKTGQGYEIDLYVFEAAQDFPNVFSKEVYSRYHRAWIDALSLWRNNGKISYDGKTIRKNVSIEEFFEKKGFPISVFPLNFDGRENIKSTVNEIREFQDTSIGKIISARVTNGQEISPDSMNALIDIALVIAGKKHSDGKCSGYEGLFEAFMKDAIDHYGMRVNLVSAFISRINTLRSHGVMPTEDTIRTRNFHAVINAENYKLKKDCDIVKKISENPIEALKFLQVRKDS